MAQSLFLVVESLTPMTAKLNSPRPKLVSIEREANTDWAKRSDRVRKTLRENKAKKEDTRLEAGPSSSNSNSRTSVFPGSSHYKVHYASLYLNLDFWRHQIRLFELYPDQGTGDIRGVFRCGELSSCEAFTALPYTWGDETELRHIDFGSGKALGIRDNLWQFLHGQSLLITQPKTFWIDAICIDQTNVRERNHQVNLMRDIYTRAEKVYIWLGKEADESDPRTSQYGVAPRVVNGVPLKAFTLKRRL